MSILEEGCNPWKNSSAKWWPLPTIAIALMIAAGYFWDVHRTLPDVIIVKLAPGQKNLTERIIEKQKQLTFNPGTFRGLKVIQSK